MPFTTVLGHRLEYERIEATRPGLPPLVLLHEGLGSIALWKDFPQKLARATGAQTTVFSRYGYGNSDPLAGRRGVDYMHREGLEALPAFLDTLDIERPVLIGHSDGASIALIHAGGTARPVAGLILEAPHVFVEDLTVDSIAQAKTVYETTDLARKLGRYHADVDNVFWGWNDIWLDPAFRAWNIEEYLPAVTVPVLIIQGEDDEYGTVAQCHAIEAEAGGPVETVLLPDCRHSPHRDQETATLQAMTRFISRLAEEQAA
ncbi:MAG: alpha/beta hydrolase [Azospirillaceae bacterium]